MSGPGALPADPVPYLALASAVLTLSDQGRHPSCAGSPLPTSDDVEDRAEVVRILCPGCPVLEQCRTAGQQETFGVWGGSDRTGQRRTHTERRYR